MNDDTVFKSEPSARDLAPPTPVAPQSQATASMAAVAPALLKSEDLLHLEPQKRKKTWGETRFNLETYGGIALVGNEASSLLITNLAENGPTRALYTQGRNWFKRFEGNRLVPKYVSSGDLQGVLVALIGGMLMVPFVKWREDHKGETVREYDRSHYGAQTFTDPALVATHKEMDDAPKQSWGSLWKGRALTVVGAIGVDSLAGRTDAPLTKLFRDNKLASMDGIAQLVAKKSLAGMDRVKSLFKGEPAALFQENARARASTGKWMERGTWLLTLSSTLTIGFYVSSKLFAKHRDQRIERQHEQLHSDAPANADAPAASSSLPERAVLPAQPQPKVSAVEHQDMLSVSPSLMHV